MLSVASCVLAAYPRVVELAVPSGSTLDGYIAIRRRPRSRADVGDSAGRGVHHHLALVPTIAKRPRNGNPVRGAVVSYYALEPVIVEFGEGHSTDGPIGTILRSFNYEISPVWSMGIPRVRIWCTIAGPCGLICDIDVVVVPGLLLNYWNDCVPRGGAHLRTPIG